MGKTVVVTGGAQGIGAALADAFKQQGFNVAIADLAFSEFERRGSILSGPCDVRERASAASFIDRVVGEFGTVDVLVNNAGIYPMQPFEDISPDDWDKVLGTNAKSVFNLSQLTIPHMKKRSWGRIINIASNTFFMGTPNLVHYVASKGAIIGFSRALAAEMGRHGITVNCVAPNFTRTEGTAVVEATAPEIVELTVAMQAVPRVSKPRDIVGTVLFLASDQSEFMTGQTLVVDGGGVKH